MINYIFVVKETTYDGVVTVTTNFKKALNEALWGDYSLSCYVDNDENNYVLFDVCCYDGGLQDMMNNFKNSCTGLHVPLLDIIVPIMDRKIQDSLQKKKEERIILEKQEVERELKLLAELKAKYESK